MAHSSPHQVYTYKQSALTRQKVHTMHPSSISGVEDMAGLGDLHDGAIMHNLYLRYQQDKIYVSHVTCQRHSSWGITHDQSWGSGSLQAGVVDSSWDHGAHD